MRVNDKVAESPINVGFKWTLEQRKSEEEIYEQFEKQIRGTK